MGTATTATSTTGPTAKGYVGRKTRRRKSQKRQKCRKKWSQRRKKKLKAEKHELWKSFADEFLYRNPTSVDHEQLLHAMNRVLTTKESRPPSVLTKSFAR